MPSIFRVVPLSLRFAIVLGQRSKTGRTGRTRQEEEYERKTERKRESIARFPYYLGDCTSLINHRVGRQRATGQEWVRFEDLFEIMSRVSLTATTAGPPYL